MRAVLRKFSQVEHLKGFEGEGYQEKRASDRAQKFSLTWIEAQGRDSGFYEVAEGHNGR